MFEISFPGFSCNSIHQLGGRSVGRAVSWSVGLSVCLQRVEKFQNAQLFFIHIYGVFQS